MSNYDESERSQMEDFMREALGEDIPLMQNGILTKALVISEWLMADGRRYLARSPIGELTQWDIQGFCFSTLESEDWEYSKDIDPDDDEDEEEDDEK